MAGKNKVDLRGGAGGLPALLYVELTRPVQTFTHKRLQVLLAAVTAEQEGEGGAGNGAPPGLPRSTNSASDPKDSCAAEGTERPCPPCSEGDQQGEDDPRWDRISPRLGVKKACF